MHKTNTHRQEARLSDTKTHSKQLIEKYIDIGKMYTSHTHKLNI